MAESEDFNFRDGNGTLRKGRAQAFGNEIFSASVVVTARKTVLGCVSSTQTGATAKALGTSPLTIPAGTTHALVTIDGSSARFRDDNIDPTTTGGLYVPDGSALEFCLADLTDVAFIAVSGTININVSYYKYDD